jgi:hypothetical protein
MSDKGDKYKEMPPNEEADTLARINLLRSLLPPSPFDGLFNRARPVRGEYELITNFNKDCYEVYEEALERYTLLSDAPKKLKLDVASNEYCDYGLWIKSDESGDLSVFWRIYKEAKAAK